MKATALFGAAVVVIVLLFGALLAIPFSSADEIKAIGLSGGIALVVQLVAFVIARRVPRQRFLTGWLVGATMRFVTLVVWAFLVLKVVVLPAPAALISLVTFFFVSTLVEPKLLSL